MTLRTRILFGFAVAFLACLGLGLISLYQTHRLNAVAARFGAELLPHVSVLADLRAEVNEHNRILLRHVIADTPQAMATLESQLTDETGLIDAFFRNAGSAFTAPQQQRLLETARGAWAAYREAAAGVIALGHEGGGQRMEAAALDRVGGLYQKFVDTVNTMRQTIVLEAWTGVGTTRSTYLFGMWLTIGAMVACAGVCGIGGVMTISSVCRPVLTLAGQMRQVAAREPGIVVFGCDRRDEVGAMAQALEQFRQDLAAADATAAQQETEHRAQEQRTMRVTGLAADFDHSISAVLEAFSAAAHELESTAHSMANIAESTNRQALGSAEGARQASANVQTVAASAEELAASLGEIAQQVGRSSQMVAEATAEARATDANVGELAEAAGRIGEVVQLISSIASQTNLLALNATIEAARAGDAGKGFAVVAAEVKALANQTTHATDEIARQIAAIQGSTGRAVEAIRRITSAIAAVSEVATGIAAAVEQQTAAVTEISRSAADAAQHTNTVSSAVAAVTNASAEAGTAATQVLDAAGDLGRQTASLRGEVTRFTAEIRAA
ncbi:HAMP domain-containing protein [Rhodovastum atsumiense]|nr:methyl-accepting chemotaxis protein [Rhodovastum atsumiense]CAH2604960.1 HAMP domain-containing protein [Rhodovastum atsumiense]